MKVENEKIFTVVLGSEKHVVQTREKAIKVLKELVNKTNESLENLNPEVIEVDMSEEQWSLTGLPWNQIAIELMRGK